MNTAARPPMTAAPAAAPLFAKTAHVVAKERSERLAIGIAPATQQQLANERLSRLDRLTPGDFQTVLRRRRLVGAGDALEVGPVGPHAGIGVVDQVRDPACRRL